MSGKRTAFTLLVTLVLAGFLLAACGSTATGSGTTPTTTMYSTPTTAPTPTPTTAPATTADVATAKATVNGQSVTILTNARGMTLYYNKNDSATSITCTGGCASAWPPLTGSGTPTSSTTLPGTLSIFQGQIEYQGHPLYTYVGDTQPGQTTGENAGGIWFVATTTLASASSGGSSTSAGY